MTLFVWIKLYFCLIIVMLHHLCVNNYPEDISTLQVLTSNFNHDKSSRSFVQVQTITNISLKLWGLHSFPSPHEAIFYG